MTKVYTLEGGMKAWSEAYPNNVAPFTIDATIAFAGSSSLAPVIASIGEAFST
jgi:hypothetical protein